MQLRFVSWNMHCKRRLEGQLGLLQYIAGDLVVFQEVIANAYNEPIASKLFAWSTFSLDLSPLLMGDGRRSRLSCAVLGHPPFCVRKHSLLGHAAFSEMALVMGVTIPSVVHRRFAAFICPLGVYWKERKPQALMTLADWFATHAA